ncbi:MAG TPA: tetratricopeptide repeat protein [Gemmataceae bacterium]|jgi:tetratricopeptide (TPR) repeat protein
MARLILPAFGFLRRRLWRIVSLGVVLVAAALGGVNLWAWHHFRAAEKALREEHTEEAQSHISHCLHIWGRSSETHLLAARIDRAAGRYVEAERHLTECVRLQHGASEETQIEQFLIRAQAGDLHEVEGGLWKCIKAGHPASPRILETLAQVYVREMRLMAAMDVLSRWIVLEPQAARAWQWRGCVREQLEQPEWGIIPDFEKAVELEPERWGARMHLVRLILKRNDLESARPHLEVLLRHHADNLDVQLFQAQAFHLEGRIDEAVRLLDRLLQIQPHNFDALYLGSQLACEREPPRYQEAERLLRLALAERPADHSALHALYRCLEDQGKAREAAQMNDHIHAVEADLNRLMQLRKKAIELTPNDPQTLAEMGEILLRFGNAEEGLAWLNRALRLNPNHAPSHEILIRYYESKDKAEEADRHRQKLAQLTRRSPSAPETGK